MAEPTVRMSGIVLASLMFHHVNSDSDVEGLVLGESRFEEQITISDSQADHIHIEETYNIQKHVSCPKLSHVYNSVGEVDLEAVKQILADSKQASVIGWYRQRRNTDQQMTFRERIIHEKLKTSLSNPHMIFVLLTPGKMSSTGSTYRTEYAAFISRSRRFLNVPVLVNNLGLLEQLAYWKVSAPCSAEGYNLTMKKHRSKFFSPDGQLRDVSEVNNMNESLQEELQRACGEVEESERLVKTLQAEVSALRRKLKEKRRSGAETEPVDDPAKQKKNLRLKEVVRALFSSSPLFLSQTLTLDGFPVPEVCCSPEQENLDSFERNSQETLSVPPLQTGRKNGVKNGMKRPREPLLGRERKRRKSRS
ncbi:BRCA1-A complex subunit Abraxas 1 [Xyrichtys novacula]|uniref:BRCA1-A complex subunit Abraxas 1 n=1 Tax=Xyrichtys novacula TaxID=13765 RepID=A0AAV1GBD3_XYRNO|nr:BRCA1-A complex subunit Abraxas 1 [Xyrichtys novacula]